MKQNRGISLIVLVITIIVIIILAGAVILSLADNNPINAANEAVFKSDLSNIMEEIRLYSMLNIQSNGTFKYPTKEEIKTMNKFEPDVMNFFNNKLLYKTSDSNTKKWAEDLGIMVDYTDGLLAHYNMNGNAIDSALNNNGIIYGAVATTDRFGKLDSALQFGNNGTNNILAPFYGVNTKLTVCAWIYPTSYPTERSTIVVGSRDNYIYNSFYLSLTSNGALNSYWYDTNPSGYHTTLAGVIPLNSWSFVCTSWDGVNNRLYVNGSLLKTSATSGEGRVSTLINIGAESLVRQFYGSIDDVRVYDRALSQTEIDNLYTNIYWDN